MHRSSVAASQSPANLVNLEIAMGRQAAHLPAQHGQNHREAPRFEHVAPRLSAGLVASIEAVDAAVPG